MLSHCVYSFFSSTSVRTLSNECLLLEFPFHPDFFHSILHSLSFPYFEITLVFVFSCTTQKFQMTNAIMIITVNFSTELHTFDCSILSCCHLFVVRWMSLQRNQTALIAFPLSTARRRHGDANDGNDSNAFDLFAFRLSFHQSGIMSYAVAFLLYDYVSVLSFENRNRLHAPKRIYTHTHIHHAVYTNSFRIISNYVF